MENKSKINTFEIEMRAKKNVILLANWRTQDITDGSPNGVVRWI